MMEHAIDDLKGRPRNEDSGKGERYGAPAQYGGGAQDPNAPRSFSDRNAHAENQGQGSRYGQGRDGLNHR